jgi:hypothetical protein
MTNLRLGLLTAVAGAALLTACGKNETPVTPTAPTSTVTSVSISQLPASLGPGETAQLTATATLSDGRTQSATTLVTWSSSALAILSVSPTGLVTAVAPGDATVTASYQSRSTTMGVSVRGGQALQGLITETAPTTARVVPGAQVMVVDGPYQGATATTDTGGRFSLANVAGALNLRVSKAGFDTLSLRADAGGAEVTVRLMPNGSETSVANWRCESPCNDADFRDQGRLSFDLHRTGTVTLSVGGYIQGSDAAPICGELRVADTNQLMFTQSSAWQIPFARTENLAGGRRYELRVYACGPRAGRLYFYNLTALHPS